MNTAALTLFLLLLTSQQPSPTQVTLTGTVILLEEHLKEQGIPADSEVAAQQAVLKADDGTITPLLSSVASRALVLDKRLRNRKAQIQGQMRPGFPYLEVVLFRVEEQGQFRIPEYWCDVCSISVRFPQICPCCQGEMTLQYKGLTD